MIYEMCNCDFTVLYLMRFEMKKNLDFDGDTSSIRKFSEEKNK